MEETRLARYTGDMSLQLVYFWSKKLHKLAMWFVAVLGTVMASGGLMLHRELEGEWIPSMIDTMFIRYWHNKLSTPFAFFLMIMIVTGLLMWGIPKLLSRKVR